MKKYKVDLEQVQKSIYVIRGERVICDEDLARLYQVKTKVFNQAIRRNLNRFPPDFAFQLNEQEARTMRSQFVTASKRNIRHRAIVFTEHGALMAANILQSKQAVSMSVYVIRAFIKMREALTLTLWMQKKLAEIEKILIQHDSALGELFQKIQPLLIPPPERPKRRMGFHQDN